ncbi:hypothetical protein ACVIHF_008775 [Bradyrhizobium sp. USDA 4506]
MIQPSASRLSPADQSGSCRRTRCPTASYTTLRDTIDAVRERRLFAHAGVRRGFRRRVEPDWASLACELKGAGVNLMLLWEVYRAVHPEGYGYSRFCDLFREFERRLSPTMRHDHPAGDNVFVDYSGKKVMIVDRESGFVRRGDLRRRTWRLELHLRRGDLDADTSGLDRGPRPHVRSLAGTTPGRSRQSEVRCPPGFVLRS